MGVLKNLFKKLRKDNNPLTQEEKELLETLKDCIVKNGVYTYYRHNVRGRKYENNDTIRKLLIRNIILSSEKEETRENSEVIETVFYYGNLEIVYNNVINQIVYVKNHHVKQNNIKINKVKKEWLNKELGIIDKKVPYDVYKRNRDIRMINASHIIKEV